MGNNRILFDDWAVRPDNAFNRRKKDYCWVLAAVCTMLVFSIVALFFVWPVIIVFVLSLISLISIILEWCKIKNHHLIIKENQIEVTNRFNKTTVYKINIKNMSLDLHTALVRRGGGIKMIFFDSDSNLVCKYEDMLNRASLLGESKTDWEISIMALGIKIFDPQEIIKKQ